MLSPEPRVRRIADRNEAVLRQEQNMNKRLLPARAFFYRALSEDSSRGSLGVVMPIYVRQNAAKGPASPGRSGSCRHRLGASLREAQIKSPAAYFERQTPDRNDTVAADACAGCHGEGFVGGPVGPRLAVQGEAYLVAQLVAFKRGERPDPTEAMNTMAASLSDQDIKTAARYLAGLTPGSPR